MSGRRAILTRRLASDQPPGSRGVDEPANRVARLVEERVPAAADDLETPTRQLGREVVHVRTRHEQIVLALQEQHFLLQAAEVETPRPHECEVVVDPAAQAAAD